MLPGIHLPVRAVLVTTELGNILLSPIDFSARQIDEIRSQGEVIAIVEPNTFHNKWAMSAKRAFPKAPLWGVPGSAKRNAKARWEKTLTVDEWPFEAELPHQFLAGADKINEVVFLELSTRTLLVTDLVFNILKPKGVLAPLAFRMMGYYKRFAVSTVWGRAVKDRPAFAASLQRVLAWDFDRLIMSHGKMIASGAKPKLEAALREAGWLT